MRKTHGKKQTRKNKTKRRAIRGGVKKLSYRIAGHNQRAYKGLGSNYAAKNKANT